MYPETEKIQRFERNTQAIKQDEQLDIGVLDKHI